MEPEGEKVDGKTFRRVTSACALAVLLCAGCGYRAGFTMPEGMRTIFVEVFKNRTFYRGLDFELTELVKREILSLTDLKVVRKKDADVVLSCSLDKVDKSVLQEDENDLPQEVQLSVSITAAARDRSEKVIFSEKKLVRSVRYVVALGESEEVARSRALREIAEELVYRLAEQWSWKGKKKGPSPVNSNGKGSK